ncbi:MAG: toll/interleukin-1 receptor domain-containing protein [Saprospiraceae bacterium]|nr:toll/interleukin-1 receptor domain-containing protein [Saprospiraceae bacterium]
MADLQNTKNTLGDQCVTDLSGALKNLQSLLPGAAPKKKDILALQGRLESVNTEKRNNLIDFDDYDIKMSRIRYDFLGLVESLSEQDFDEVATPAERQVGAVPKFMFVYDVEEEPFATKLNKHLFLQKRSGKLRIYNVYADLKAGDPVEEAKKELADTDYIICLFTLNLITGVWLDFIWECLSAGKRVIPVRIADIPLDGSGLEKYKSLPSQNRTISAFKSEDAAYADIATEIGRLLPR